MYDPIVMLICLGFSLTVAYLGIRAYPKLMVEAIEQYIKDYRAFFVEEK